MTALEAQGLCVERAGCRVLDGIGLTLEAGTLLGVAGPNGAGKSTLLRACAGLEPLTAGQVAVAGQDLRRLPRSARARQLGYLPQGPGVAWSLPVRDVVALGRYALRAPAAVHAAAVARALAALDLAHLAMRPVDRLSGGERMRVHLARLLAGEHRIVLADEPTASLDPYYQLEVMDALARMAAAGVAVAVVLHDLALAARYCSELLVLDGGRPVAAGPPAAALSDEVLRTTFRVRAVRAGGALAGFAPADAGAARRGGAAL